MSWSPDGGHIAFASTRMGFKDEMTYTDAPQPYGEIFVMRYDGTNLQQLTDNHWEEGTPAWTQARRAGGRGGAGSLVRIPPGPPRLDDQRAAGAHRGVRHGHPVEDLEIGAH